ncbi:MAG: rod shape-determining protein MreC [Solirubrobacteraceae bacterium]
MYDKQVRRRRLTLAAFVIASVLLLTVYFGEGAGGGLHSVQRGALSVLAPIQEGAHRALKPFRDLFGWAGDTIDAKQERDELVEENERLTEMVTQLQAQADVNTELKALLQINEAGMDAFEPVPTLVYSRTSNLFYSQVQIDKGSSAGVAQGQPVITGLGLLGRVTEVTSNAAVVSLVTDESFATGVKVLGAKQQSTIVASPNNPGVLELTGVDNPDKVSRGDTVVTAGSSDPKYRSYYPRGIRIGTVSDIELGEGNLDSRIRVKPSVDLGNLEWVEVLTRPDVDATVAALP